MKIIQRQSLIEITATHLREGFREGRWRGHLPGVRRLSEELAVSKDTLRAALKILENDGTLQPQGAGKSRIITSRRSKHKRILRIALLIPIPLLQDNAHSQRLILTIKSNIEHEGHVCVIVDQVEHQKSSSMRRVAKLVTETAADAWLIYAGSRELLEWFIAKSIPMFALGGRLQNLPLASSRTDLVQAMNDCIDALVALGHRRIVLIAPKMWRLPTPNVTSSALLARLIHHGIPGTIYNIPDWEETSEGLESLMDALFFATPPTALLFAEPSYCVAARTMLAERGLHVPRDYSLVNLLPDPVFNLQSSALTQFDWPQDAHVHRILRWIKAILAGQEDRLEFVAYAKFMPGETIAPVKSSCKLEIAPS